MQVCTRRAVLGARAISPLCNSVFQRSYRSVGINVPPAYNEPVLSYEEGTPGRQKMKEAIQEMRKQEFDIPIIINGKEIRTNDTKEIRCPHDTKHKLGQYHCAGEKEIGDAIEASIEAKAKWADLSWESRASIFLKAADLLAGPYRFKHNAATVLGQSKTYMQAEIDSACEAIDFFRWNVHFAQNIYREQPVSSPGVWNRSYYRPLEGFVYAVTPFNFAAIGSNLPSAPAIMGNTVVWKPSSASTILNNYLVMKLFQEAGLPDGVINFLPGDSAAITNQVLAHKKFNGVHYTGSTQVFLSLWKDIAKNIENYESYPRIVGETGGKDFIFAHKSADVGALATGIIRGAFEYAGQKCSACSRVYVPDNLWGELKDRLVSDMKEVKMGSPEDPTVLVNAVIHQRSFDNCKSYLDYVKSSDNAEIISGGGCDDSVGYFVEPTIVVTTDPSYKLMEEEIFGPIVTIYVYDADKYEETLAICDKTSPYALTGAIFARDRGAIEVADKALQNAAGNFYINDKPTGAVVGQQPFGGGRASGTNDKAGAESNLTRWVNARTVKETFAPPSHFAYPYMK
eukprot:CAMPEP_0174261118 /NCGR_PEP_ID=MMETSP0439-20130205/11242_1 /TAXON_ID=0 /ORGANISM="Stereomyxa ramosa, Strain Chinc5" /LENGTH=568 /DNA_ID=CAMNT_0015345545 /DNA_START=17 /DNA_END=1723 /DNA_ORIENTATION=-